MFQPTAVAKMTLKFTCPEIWNRTQTICYIHVFGGIFQTPEGLNCHEYKFAD